jgi:hypothetical protein
MYARHFQKPNQKYQHYRLDGKKISKTKNMKIKAANAASINAMLDMPSIAKTIERNIKKIINVV